MMNERVIYPSLEGYERDVINSTHAGFGSRLVAYLVDGIVIGSLKNILLNPLANLFNWDLSQYFLAPIFSIGNMATALIYFLYFILMTWFFRATLGKMLMGLKVVSTTGAKLTFLQVLTREWFGRYISGFLWSLLYLVVLFNPKKQGIHDMLSDTVVIHERQERLRDRLESGMKQNNSL
ncbi:RDD family protein [Macrococcus carouselicus]|uniref:RDD family protein n=1 Tax=Macrococcus carouselicus TaxID=69969 RepID=A0A9Q8FR93_9STAP|nr:RDD family protein [Macrococcus carouselicus]TDM04538.1 RDD family protein [Macrococcus carouselicus]